MKKIIVTGSSGFVGKNVTNTMLKRGFSVIGIDSQPSDVNHSNFKFYQLNLLTQEKEVRKILEDSNADILVHLAYSADNGLVNPLTVEDVKDAVQVDDYLYKTANDAGIKGIFLLSTHQVYGKHKKNEIVSEYESENPETLYGELKVESEQTLINVSNEGSCYGVIMRTCPVYSEKYLFNLKAAAFDDEEKSPVVYGDGDYRISLTHVDNISDFICSVIDNGISKRYQGIYNICDSDTYQIDKIFNILKAKSLIGIIVQQKKKPKKEPLFGSLAKTNYYHVDAVEMCNSISYDNSKASKVVKPIHSFNVFNS